MAQYSLNEEFPLHKCIFNGDLKTLSSLIKTHDIDEKDKQGKSFIVEKVEESQRILMLP